MNLSGSKMFEGTQKAAGWREQRFCVFLCCLFVVCCMVQEGRMCGQQGCERSFMMSAREKTI